MKVKNVKTGEITTVEADEEDGMFGVFGFIGTIPNSKPFEGIIDMDERATSRQTMICTPIFRAYTRRRRSYQEPAPGSDRCRRRSDRSRTGRTQHVRLFLKSNKHSGTKAAKQRLLSALCVRM